jgi:hypothetical protein
MSLLKFCEWLSHTSWSVSLRDGTYDYPVLLIIHVLSIALFGGMVAIGNLRVLGAAMRSVPVSQVIAQFRPWKWIGFGVLLVTGILLSISDPVEYGGNVMYWISLLLLLAAGVNAFVFRFGIYRTVASWDNAAITPRSARRWAGLSLTLWIALVFAGRAIAFF